MGAFPYGQNPNKDDVIYFLNEIVKSSPTYADVINDLVIGNEQGTSPSYTRRISVEPKSRKYDGWFNITYTISNKTDLSTLITTKYIDTAYNQNYDFVAHATTADNANKKYILQCFINANASANLNINQLDINALDYSSDAVLKQRIGNATIISTSWSSLYTGSVNVTFLFKPRLASVLTVGELEQGYDVNDQTQAKANLVQSCFDKNCDRIRDFEFCKANIKVSTYTNLQDVTFECYTSVYIGANVQLTIYSAYVPTPESIFTYSTDNKTITGFVNDNTDLSGYNVLNFPDIHNSTTITGISKVFSPAASNNTGASYQSLKDGGSLKYLHLPASLTTFPNNGFESCNSFIGNIYIPGSSSVNSYCFHACINITSITLNSPYTGAGSYAFQDCNNLRSITFPNSTLSCGYHLAGYCPYLNSIYVPDSVTSLGNACFKQDGRNINQKELYLGHSVNSIAGSAFRGCGNFKILRTKWDALPTVRVDDSNNDGSFSNGTNFDFIHNDGSVSAQDIIDLLRTAGLSGTPVIV